MSAVRAPVICLRFRGLSRIAHRRCSPVALRIIDRTTPSMSQLPDALISLSAGDEVQAARHDTPDAVVPQAPLFSFQRHPQLALQRVHVLCPRWLLLRPIRTVERLRQRSLSCPALRETMRRLLSRASLLRHPRSNANHLGAHRRRVPTCRATSLLAVNAGTISLLGFVVSKRLR